MQLKTNPSLEINKDCLHSYIWLHKKGEFNLGPAESSNEVTAKELSRDTEIYVDMDGVLVDFGEWTKMMGVSDWKQIKNVDTAKKLNKKLGIQKIFV